MPIWQLESWQRAIDSLPHTMLMYASDVFWPCTPTRHREQFRQPQLELFEVAVTRGHLAGEGSDERAQLRAQIFFNNGWDHWQSAVRAPQQPRAASQKILTPRASTRECCRQHHQAPRQRRT